MNPGDIILADPDGVIVIPRKDAAVILEEARKFQAADEAKLEASKTAQPNVSGWTRRWRQRDLKLLTMFTGHNQL